MRRMSLFIGLLALPLSAFALDFTDVSGRYSDAPFPTDVAAGVSVLTNLGAIEGNPDGTFAPDRSVNRAEFVKIFFGSDPFVSPSNSDADNCFPDVSIDAWYSRYVCLAAKRDVVRGNPDGKFHPERPVNYAEALAILGREYGLSGTTSEENPAWYELYRLGAYAEGVGLPGMQTQMSAVLTRGQVARLAASYRAWHDGELPQYRAFERGESISSSSSSSSSASNQSTSSSSSSSSPSSASSVSSVSSASSASLFPSVSHFLIVGTRTAPVLDGVFTSSDEDAAIRIVELTLRQEVKSISSMVLVDANGVDIGTLSLATDNNTDNRKWRLVIADDSGYVLKKGVPTLLGVELNLYPRMTGGVANELMDGIESLSMTVNGLTTNESKSLVPVSTNYPAHQTADGRITAVRNAGSGAYSMTTGQNKVIGRFAIAGETATGGAVQLSSMEFTLQSTDAQVTNIRIGWPGDVQQAGCGIDSVQASHVICSTIPDGFKSVGTSPTIITIYGDVSLRTGSTAGTMQIIFAGPGQIGKNGAIRWQDAVGKYNWIESTVPLQNGTVWTVGQ